MNRLKYLLQHRYYLKILAIITIILVYIVTTNYHKHSIYSNEEEFIGTVYKIAYKNDRTTLYIKNQEKLIIHYYDELLNVSLGDTVKVNGKLSAPSNNTIPNLFNYHNYLSNINIFYIVKANKITKIRNNTSIIYYLRNRISKRIDKISNNNAYLSIFLLGDKSSLSKEVIESYRNNGIIHLFSISGMHISLFTMILFFILKRLSYNNYYNYGVVIVFLLFYTIFIGSSPSLIRSFVMYLLFALNKLLNIKASKTNIMYLLLSILITVNPYYIYNQAFWFSYLISFSLIFKRSQIKHIKNKLIKSLYISYLSFLVSLPICLYNNFQINILSILLNIVFIPLVSLIIFPLSLICFVFPKLISVLYFLTKIIENISLLIDAYRIGIIIFFKPSFVLITVYYFFLFLFLYNKKSSLIILLLLIYKIGPIFNHDLIVTFLDVNQGDSILIRMPHNNENILIDTGGDNLSNNPYAKNSTIPYLKSIGINRLSYLIITHGDFDHMGEAINLVNNFKVEKVIFNCGPYNDLEKELIKVLNKKKIDYYSCIKELNIDDNKLYFLQTKEYDNENDNSNVIYTELNGYKFMFMGDAGIDKEKDILEKYNLSDIDVLKVGHHGSKTSSSKEFINEIKPKYSIISVGKNNRYGHPNKEVLNNLDNSKIYRTDKQGSIMFKIKNNKLKIETCSP